MTLHYMDIVFQLIAFLFAISVHESSHAWMANLRGDPTARLLGRISLNPIRHIDPIGTLLLPAVALFFHVPVLGWAKPTPVDPRNFKNPVLDDILTSVVGPISNFTVAICVFNLIPVPPLDGSHVVRHLLPAGILRVYDTVGTFGLLLLVFWGGGLLGRLISPAIGIFNYILLRI
jgi:Zn-dependent protease